MSDRPFKAGDGPGFLATSALSVALFFAAAWPLFFVEVPPFQDLFGHLATLEILGQPQHFSDFVPTGFFKTNSTLFALGTALRPLLSSKAFVKLFTVGILALNAWVLPRFVRFYSGSSAMVQAAPLYGLLVLPWFVATGMLNFSLSSTLTLVLLMGLELQKEDAKVSRGLGLAALTAAIWYTHVFPLICTGVILLPWVVRQLHRRQPAQLVRTLMPLAIAVPMAAVSTLSHFGKGISGDAPAQKTVYDPVTTVIYDVWSRSFFTLGNGTTATLVPALCLVWLAFRKPRTDASSAAADRMFGPASGALLGIAYLATPAAAGGWAFFSVRFVPYLWFFVLTRLKTFEPRPIRYFAYAAAAVASLGGSLDILKAEADVQQLAAARTATPGGAALLPMIFDRKGSAKNTWPLDSASALYVTDRQTTPFDLWAENASMPVLRTRKLPAELSRVGVNNFLNNAKSIHAFCERVRENFGTRADCETEFRRRWSTFWRVAGTEFTHVLLFKPHLDVLATLPGAAQTLYANDGTFLVHLPATTSE